jgi:hypothetical protein
VRLLEEMDGSCSPATCVSGTSLRGTLDVCSLVYIIRPITRANIPEYPRLLPAPPPVGRVPAIAAYSGVRPEPAGSTNDRRTAHFPLNSNPFSAQRATKAPSGRRAGATRKVSTAQPRPASPALPSTSSPGARSFEPTAPFTQVDPVPAPLPLVVSASSTKLSPADSSAAVPHVMVTLGIIPIPVCQLWVNLRPGRLTKIYSSPPSSRMASATTPSNSFWTRMTGPPFSAARRSPRCSSTARFLPRAPSGSN